MFFYHKTKHFVTHAFDQANKPNDVYHAKRTAYWIKKLKSNADEALLIAGLAHDLERAFYGDWKHGSSKPADLARHEHLSAEATAKFLRKEKAAPSIINRVKKLILHHEQGGNEDENILCDADCLAYFEEKALRLAKDACHTAKREEMKQKLAYVYSRLHTSKTRQIAELWYQKAMKELERK